MKKYSPILLLAFALTSCKAETSGWVAYIKTECKSTYDQSGGSGLAVHSSRDGSEGIVTAKMALTGLNSALLVLKKIDSERLWSSDEEEIQRKLSKVLRVSRESENTIKVSIYGLESDLGKDILEVLTEFYCSTGGTSTQYDEKGNVIFEEECTHAILRIEKF